MAGSHKDDKVPVKSARHITVHVKSIGGDTMNRQQDGETTTPEDLKILLALDKGMVTIIEDDAQGVEKATILLGSGVSVFINGQEVIDRGEVYTGDKVEIKPVEETVADQIEIKVSADGMRAEARYLPGRKKTHIIKNHPPTKELKIGGEPFEEKLITITLADIVRIVKEARIVYGLSNDIIYSLIDTGPEWQTIATGKPVVQGKDGWIEPQFVGNVKAVTYDEEEDKVDFRQSFEIEQVAEKSVIAIIHPPVRGEAGKKVTGEDIEPDPVSRVVVSCDSGTELSSDGHKVIATRKGIPFYQKGRIHSFRVEDVYIHQGDVDINSGNIDYRGHVKLQGGVTEGMRVSVDGDVEIEQNASGAEILAGGNITFKNYCIKCKVQAGWVDLVLKALYTVANIMSKSVNSALDASEELAAALEAKGKHTEQMEAEVVRALLQNKFPELPVLSTTMLKHIREAGHSLPEEMVKVIREIVPYFIDYQYSQALGRPVLREISQKLQNLNAECTFGTERADIKALYVQNSELSCTGNIMITGAGVYNSRLKCNGEVKIARLFRGGSIEAGGDVYIGEAGEPRVTADHGLIAVPFKGKVHLGIAHENLRVRFGTTEYRCDKNYKNICLDLDQVKTWR